MDFIKENLRKFKIFFSKLNDDNLSEYAAQAAYFTILSFIPFTLFFLSLIKFTNIDKDTIYLVLKDFIPSSIHETILNIIEEIYSKSGEILSITLIIAIWSAGKGFFSLYKGLRNIYKVDKPKSNLLLRIEGSIYTLILIFSIIVFLFLIVIGNKLYIYIMSNHHELSKIFFIIFQFRNFLSIFLMFVIFLLLYKFVPKNKIKISKHIYGAIFSSIGWNIMSFFFSIYMDISDGFTNMYGSLSSIILIMLWVYACMYIILLGAEINVIINDYKNRPKLLNKGVTKEKL